MGTGDNGCSDTVVASNCPTDFGLFGEVSGSLVPGGRCASTWHIPEYVSTLEAFSDDELNWAEPLYQGGVECSEQDASTVYDGGGASDEVAPPQQSNMQLGRTSRGVNTPSRWKGRNPLCAK